MSFIKFKYIDSFRSGHLLLVDSSFEELISFVAGSNYADLYLQACKVYRRRHFPLATNLVLLARYYSNGFKYASSEAKLLINLINEREPETISLNVQRCVERLIDNELLIAHG